ncbi:MAG: anaerobic ribonucleoside-triphosphate reductase activating protein, partial [Lachnospiraceae bacterium]|nr:anaerobic ribonucleoside-triphosphate reductase activating protein [Lachnospiraceae bacterium]
MHIAGITKNTLLDYPGRVAAAIFTGGCDLRCLFCQNSSLVEGLIPEIKEEDVLSFLEKRRNNLTGVCITGGEPTLQPDLPDFIMKVRDLGYAVKVDTNGTEPKMLRELADRKLVDYVALDINTGRKQYREL